MKKILIGLSALLVVLVFAWKPFGVKATHVLASDLEYTCLGGNVYEFALTVYRDCGGVSLNPSVPAFVNGVGCPGSSPIYLSRQSIVEVSPLCANQLPNSTCSGGSLPGIQEHLYTATINLGTACVNWNISWGNCCRSLQLTNITNPGSARIYVEASLNNSGGQCNSTPSFSSIGGHYICDQQQFCMSSGAVDPDGDSLVFSLVTAQEGSYPGTPLNYATPNSATYPISTVSGSVNLNPQDGSMCIVPNGLQNAVVSIRVDEFRNGVLIGSSTRDILLVVRSCGNQSPQISNNGIFNQSGGLQIDNNSVEVCLGNTISFDLEYEDPDTTDSLSLWSNLAAAIPGATLIQTGTNPLTANFSWTPGPSDIGLHFFSVDTRDNACSIFASQGYSFDVLVLGGTTAGPDQEYCGPDTSVVLAATGGSSFSWSVLSGDSSSLTCFSCPSPIAFPNVNTTYEVVSNLGGGCRNRDTVTVSLIPDFTIDAGSDTSICLNDTLGLNGLLGPGSSAPFSFAWTPSANLSNPLVLSPGASPNSSTTFHLTATSNQGCTLSDSVTIDVLTGAPLVLIPASDTLCPGASLVLNPVVNTGCDTTSAPCTNPGTQGVVTTGTLAGSEYGPGFMDSMQAYSIRRQYIFTPAELNAMGFFGGRIKSLALNFVATGSPVNQLRISMGCTGQDEFGTAPFVFLNDLIEVKSSFSLNPVPGWNDFPLDHSYAWDGVSNLAVEFCTKGTNIGSPSTVEYGCLAGRNATLHLNDSLAGACDSVFGLPSNCIPNMRFEYCEAVPAGTAFLWSPATGLSDATVQNPSASPLSNTTYELVVDNGSGCLGMGNTALVIDSSLSVVAVADDPSPCQGQLVSLSSTVSGQPVPPSGHFSYAWTPSTGLSTPDSATTSLSFAGPIVYTLSVSDGRCLVSDTVSLEDCGVVPVDLPWQTIGTAGLLSLHPNPAKIGSGLQLKYWAVESGPLELVWMDALGRMVRQKSLATVAGMNQFELSTEALAEGVYFVRVKCEGQVETRKVVLQR